jgi:WD40 repeat protein
MAGAETLRLALEEAREQAALAATQNPYVGPRPLEVGERLWGRDEEVAALFFLLSAERIVLLHSPSGAGKSSLVQAGLIRRLRGSFDVWRPTRVNQEPGLAAPAGRSLNRYVHSAILGFEQGIPPELRRSPAELAGLTLAEYAAGRPKRPGAAPSVVVIFDQFEEVLTVEPLAVAAKREFFDQLGRLLHDPTIWALFLLREEYLAPLDPYAQRVPTHLKNRFRIDLLGLAAAREAIVNPAREKGREFPVADQLVRDLAMVKVQHPDGSIAEQPGHHVEPVQLQVVCRRLWAALPEQRRVILGEDLARFGDVNAALADYYAEAVARVAGGNLAVERAIREWFGEALICGGIRNLVLRQPEASGGLANELIEPLLDTHLVRGEKRAGATWYELAHDRLIGAVQSDNLAWSDKHFVEAQRRAVLWQDQGRPPRLLLAGDELAAAERWAADAPAVTDAERLFLAASRQAQEIAERERRQTRRIRRLGFAATAVGALALVASVFAVTEMLEAHREHYRTRTQTLAEQARGLQRDQLDLALLLALEVARRGDLFEARRLLYEGLEASPRLLTLLHGHQGDVRAVAWSPDGRRLASGGTDPPLLLWEAAGGRFAATPLADAPAEVWGLAWSPDGRRLAAGGAEGAVLLWDDPGAPGAPRRLVAQASPAEEVYALRFDPAGRRLAAARSDLAVQVWDVESGETVGPGLAGATDQLRALAWSPDGRTVAAAGMDRLVRLWDAATGAPIAPPLTGHWEGVTSLDWSPDGRTLASGSLDGTVGLWRLSPGAVTEGGQRLYPQVGPVTSLAWGGDSSTLAVAGRDGRVALWDVARPERLRPLGAPAEGQTAALLGLAWSPDGRRLASGNGPAVVLWRADPGPRLGRRTDLRLLEARGIAASADGKTLAAAGKDPVAGELVVRLWDRASGAIRREIRGLGRAVPVLAWSADGRLLSAAAADRTIRRLEAASGRVAAEWRAETAAGGRLAKLAWSDSGSRLAAAGRDGSVEIWDGVAGKLLAAPETGAGAPVGSLAWSPGGGRLAAGTADGRLRLWDGSSGRRLLDAPLGPPGEELTSLAWSPDGGTLAVGSRAGSVRLWDAGRNAPDGEPLRGHGQAVLHLAWSPDGKTLASAANDRQILLWDVARREVVAGPLLGHEDTITGLSFGPSGRTLDSVGNDGVLWRWDVDFASWRERACALARRGLTPEERRRYLPDGALPEICRLDPTTQTWRTRR